MSSIKRFVLIIILFVCLVSIVSWGFLVHRTVHQLSIYELPKDMRRFFYINAPYLVSNSGRPDNRRSTDETEASKHFIDLEMYGDSAAWKIPLHWYVAVDAFTIDTLLKYGYVPYHVVYMKDKLTEAFRSRNADSILFYAADLGHYIEDANVPLHSSVNYDGQLTDQKGLHSLWESMVPEIEIGNYNLHTNHKATYLANPALAIMNAVRKAHTLLPDVFGKEKELSARFPDSLKYRIQVRRGRETKSYTSEFAKAYGASLKNTINDQLLNSANLVADFWYTSWVDAGKPDLDSLLKNDFARNDEKALKKELRSYKRNNLLKDSLLISRRSTSERSSE